MKPRDLIACPDAENRLPNEVDKSAVVKNLPASAGDVGLISGSGRSPGGGNGNPLQYSRLENSMGRGAWRAIVHGVTKSQMRLRACAHITVGSMEIQTTRPS